MELKHYLGIYSAIIVAFLIVMICLAFGKVNNKVLKKSFLDMRLFAYTIFVSAIFFIGTIIYAINIKVVNDLVYIIFALDFICYSFVIMLVMFLSIKPINNIVSATKDLGKGRKNVNLNFEGAKEFSDIAKNLEKVQQNYKNNDRKLNKKEEEYEKYIPKRYLKLFNKTKIEDLVLGENVTTKLSVLFCDVRNSFFSSETLSLEDNFIIIQEFLKNVAICVRENSGFVDKFLGDGVLAVFEKDEDALKCANEISQKLEYNNLVSIGKEKLVFGLALHSGPVILGVIGEEKRKTITIISETVNMVSRLEHLNKIFGTKVIFSKQVLNSLSNAKDYRYIGTIKFEDLVTAVPLFESLDAYLNGEKSAKLKTVQEFESGVRCYEREEFEKAKKFFILALKGYEKDELSKIYLGKCNCKLLQNSTKNSK